MLLLRQEFIRLSTVHLTTIDRVILNKINEGNMILFSLNCQSLQAHARELRGNIIQKAHILMLSETWLRNEESVEIENFRCISQYRRPDINRGGGVSIYQNVNDSHHVLTGNNDTFLRNAQHFSQTHSNLGDICAARCTLPNGNHIVVVSIYISVNQKVNDVIDFIHETLLAYTEGGSKLLKKQYHVLPLVLSGDFNIDFNKDDGLRLIQFLKSELNLDIVSDRTLGTTRYGTTIDAVFSRFVNHVSTNVHVSYFSYHKPLVTVINNEGTIDLINT